MHASLIRRMVRRVGLALAAAVALVPVAAPSQGLARAARAAGAADTAVVAPTVAVDSASPRAAIVGFLNVARSGDFARAASWLDLSDPSTADRSAELARRLKAVLDARLWVDVERISPYATGDTVDGLPLDRELVGTVVRAGDDAFPIRLARRPGGSTPRWVFSATTVAGVDALYAALPDHWIREHLPAPLLTAGPFDVLWWQWIALLLLLPLASLLGWILAGPTQALLRRLVGRTETNLDDKLVASTRGPLVLLWGAVASVVLLRWVALAAPAEMFVHGLQRSLGVLAGFWMVLRGITVLQDALPVSAWAVRHPALRSLIPLGGRIARLITFVLGILAVIASFGYPIATILAGLGIGGIAVALGAQKSLEHFFGSISIGVDQPFRVGDFVKVEDTVGDIEAIGLRSTRIRTLDRTVVTIPNGRLAEAKAENYGERDRIRLHTMIGLEYGTPSATIRRIRDEIEALLRAHPLMWQDTVVVRFGNFGAYSLDIEIMCWLETRVFNEFRDAREELFFGIMGIVERAGSSFAFPTQTVMVKGEGRGER